MAWNPGKYNEFKSVRFKPFFDLAAHIVDKPGMEVIDLGCGTGELTAMLAGKLTDALVLGVDSSAEMLAEAGQFRKERLSFEQGTIEDQVNSGRKWDLVFSNAAIQWIDNHKQLFPVILNLVRPGGQVAIQMPCQNENLLNRILVQLAAEEPYSSVLQGWNRLSPVLSIDDYAQMLFACGGKDITVYQKVYPLIAQSHDDLYEFISGSALIPYFERLDGAVKEQFILEYKQRIGEQFPVIPALYAFKRIILYAQF
jgi:trans-aconitate 2-methyltransferase